MHAAVEEVDLDPCDLYTDLGTLIVEGRVPGQNDKGFGEGPHCFSTTPSGQNRHQCDPASPECQKYDQILKHMLLLWKNGIPMTIEVLLCPPCCPPPPNSDAVPPDTPYLLLEQWTIHMLPRRVPDAVITSKGLIHAVRSFLFFSQLSAWYSLTGGKSPQNVHYRVCVPGEAFSSKFSSQPDLHVFPVANTSRDSAMKVLVKCHPRCDLPRLPCHHIKVPRPIPGPSSSLLGDSLLDPPPSLAMYPRRYQSPQRCGSPSIEVPERLMFGSHPVHFPAEERSRRQQRRPVVERFLKKDLVGERDPLMRDKEPLMMEQFKKKDLAGDKDLLMRERFLKKDLMSDKELLMRERLLKGDMTGDKDLVIRDKDYLDGILKRDLTGEKKAEVYLKDDLISDKDLFMRDKDVERLLKNDQMCDKDLLERLLKMDLIGDKDHLMRVKDLLMSDKDMLDRFLKKNLLGDKDLLMSDRDVVERLLKKDRGVLDRILKRDVLKDKDAVERILKRDEDVLFLEKDATCMVCSQNGQVCTKGGKLKGYCGDRTDPEKPQNDPPPDIRSLKKENALKLPRDEIDKVLEKLRRQQTHKFDDCGTFRKDKKPVLKQPLWLYKDTRKSCDRTSKPPERLETRKLRGEGFKGCHGDSPDSVDTYQPKSRPSGVVVSSINIKKCGPLLANAPEELTDERELPGESCDQSESTDEFYDKRLHEIPSAEKKAIFRRSLDSATSLVFHKRSGLPLTSSPAPSRKCGTSFDYDSSLTTVSAIKRALFEKENEVEPKVLEKNVVLSTSAPASIFSSSLLGTFEESVLNGRLEPVSTVEGFTAEIGASGSFCPRHVKLPVTVFFYTLHDMDKVTSPYMGHINLRGKDYHVPKKGTVQVTLFNPHETVVRMFVVRYDLSDMPVNCQTFLRQRSLHMPSDAPPSHPDAQKWLRYLIHLRFMSSKSGRIYLHTDIRLIVFRKSDLDAATVHGQHPYELRTFLHGPLNPKYSPHKP